MYSVTSSVSSPLSKFSFRLSSNETGEVIFISSFDEGDVVVNDPTVSFFEAPVGLSTAVDPTVTRLGRRKVGGTRSGGKTSGNFSPVRTMSHKCIERTNSSQDNRPSASMSDNPLHNQN